MSDTMRAAVLREAHHIDVLEVPKPTIKNPTDVLVKVELSAICGTDLHPYEGRLDIEPDVILGHEFLGEVVDAGDAVSQVSVGDRVVATCTVNCGACYQCRRHQPGNCAGSMIFGLGLALGDLDGGQAEYVVVPNADLITRKVPDHGVATDEDILLAGDIMTTGYESVRRGMRPGDTVAIVGGGPVGLCAAMAAKALGASQVVVVDKVASRIAEAERFGAIGLNSSEIDATDALLDLTDWRGADVVIDAVGHPSAFLAAVPLLRAGGFFSIPGVYNEDSMEIPFAELYLKGITIEMGVTHFVEYIDEVIALMAAGQLKPSELISHRLGLSDAPEAYKMFAAHEATKILLDPRS